MKVKGMTRNCFTENILDWNQAADASRCTGEQQDFDHLKHLLDGFDPGIQVIHPEFLKDNGKTQQVDTIQLAKTLKLCMRNR